APRAWSPSPSGSPTMPGCPSRRRRRRRPTRTRPASASPSPTSTWTPRPWRASPPPSHATATTSSPRRRARSRTPRRCRRPTTPRARLGRSVLPPGFPASETHTVGAQVERAFGGQTLVANPIFDFVPSGGAVTTTREVATTAECNTCHGRLEAHGGGRREVRLCQLCHTDQATDPDTGNTIDFKVMIHKIHRGKDLPSLAGLITKYSIIGFQQRETVFGEDVQTCVGGPVASMPCTTDMDCQGGTCTGQSTTGVGFPRDLRDCQVCHGQG